MEHWRLCEKLLCDSVISVKTLAFSPFLMQFDLPEKEFVHIQTKENGRANIKKKFYQFSELRGQGSCLSMYPWIM